jgi:hypothetical protein
MSDSEYQKNVFEGRHVSDLQVTSNTRDGGMIDDTDEDGGAGE